MSVSSWLGTFQAHSLHPSDHSSTDSLLLRSTVFAKNFHVAAAMKTSVLLSWEVPDSYKSAVPFKVGEGHSQSSLHAGRPGHKSSPAVGTCMCAWRRTLVRCVRTSSILQACDGAPLPPLSLQILYNGQSVEVDGHSMQKLIENLEPNTEYSFVLMSRGSSAGGLQHLVSIRTAPDLLPHKPEPASAYMEDGRFTLSMPHVQDPSLIRCADEALGRRTGLVTWAWTMTDLSPALPTQVVLHRGGAH